MIIRIEMNKVININSNIYYLLESLFEIIHRERNFFSFSNKLSLLFNTDNEITKKLRHALYFLQNCR